MKGKEIVGNIVLGVFVISLLALIGFVIFEVSEVIENKKIAEEYCEFIGYNEIEINGQTGAYVCKRKSAFDETTGAYQYEYAEVKALQ